MKRLIIAAIAFAASSLALADPLPIHVKANSALQTIGAGAVASVVRDGFASAGDGGSATYFWSSSACSLNSGAGDNGSQVAPSSGTGCWLADSKGEMSVKTYGAVNSSSTTTGTISASGTTLTLATAQDFANGNGILVEHAGAAYALNQPTSLSVTPTGTTGSTAYQYQIACHDYSHGVGTAISPVSTSTGNATLSATNYNALAWTAPTGTAPAACAIYGNTSGSMTLQAVVSGTVTSWNDTGLGALTTNLPYLPSAPPSSALADDFVTSIVSGGGTTSLTLAAAATTSASGVSVSHDETAAFNAAIAWCQSTGGAVHIPAGAGQYSVSSPLTMTAGCRLYGDGYSYAIDFSGSPTSRGYGSFVALNHPGKGVYLNTNSGTVNPTGIRLENFATMRVQPTAGTAAWMPNPSDFDIYSLGGDLKIEKFMAWGSPQGIHDQGRLVIHDVQMDVFNTGLELDGVADTVKVDSVHIWPFYSTDQYIRAYKMANLTSLNMGRVDNPTVSNFSAIRSNKCINFFHGSIAGTSGETARFEGSNIGCDETGNYGLYFDTGLQATVTVQIAGLYIFNVPGSTNATHNIETLGAYGPWLQISDFRGTGAGDSAVDMANTTYPGKISIANPMIDSWGTTTGSTASTFSLASGNILETSGYPQFGGGPAGVPTASGSGTYYSTMATAQGSSNSTFTSPAGNLNLYAPNTYGVQLGVSGSASVVDINSSVMQPSLNGGMGLGKAQAWEWLRLNPLTYGSLTSALACSSSYWGAMGIVTDSTTAIVGATILGSGSNEVEAYCNSSGNWVVSGTLTGSSAYVPLTASASETIQTSSGNITILSSSGSATAIGVSGSGATANVNASYLISSSNGGLGLGSPTGNGWKNLTLHAIATSNLVTCNSTAEGTSQAVTDSNSSTFNAPFSGSGSNHILAYCNGANWVVH
jgi:hypothetical protein